MSLRTIAIGLTLAVVVAVLYSWFANQRPDGVETERPPNVATPSSPKGSSSPPPAPGTPAAAEEPLRLTSAVIPGMPVIRSQASVVAPNPPVQPPAPTPPGPTAPSAEAITAANDLDAVRRMFRDFRTRVGDNPVGTNAEIMKALMGSNPAQARLGPPEGHQLNANGELIDRWGTPYFFHQLSKDQMEIRSAGPDAQMWTGDDLVGQ